MSRFEEREQHIAQYGFVKVTDALVAALKPYCLGVVVEVMAGTGHLAAALRAAGVELRATDDFSWHPGRWPQLHSPIEREDAAVTARNADTVIMLWPYMDLNAHRVAQAMKPGAALIYCGEGQGGCTASNEFFELMEGWSEDEKFDEAVNPHHHQWHGIHDYWHRWTKPEAT